MSDNKHHITPLSTYLIVFSILLLMTGITIYSAQYDFGSFNIILALIIASFKASLVLLFFMHLYYDNKINLVFILISILMLVLFIGITLIDVTKRTDIYKIKGKIVNPQAEIYHKLSKAGTKH